MKKILILATILFWTAGLNAQCVQWLTGDAPVVVSDDSDNDPALWRDPRLFDPFSGATDLAEATVQPTAVALRRSGAWCTGGQQVSAAVHLDLDGDGAPESVWRTGQTMAAGFWPLNNRSTLFNHPADSVLYHPGYVGADRTSRLLPVGVQQGDTLVYTLWLELADGNGVQRLPLLLPYGMHRVAWRIDAGPSFDVLEYTLDIRYGGALTITTCVATPDGVPLNNVLYTVSVPAGTAYTLSDDGGCTTLMVPGAVLPPGTEICMTPSVPDDDPLIDAIRQGVSLFDVLATYRHILGIEPLGGPYKQIGADVNKSGSLNTADIVAMLRMLTGRLTEWPNSLNWRLVDGQFVFPNPTNPFQTSIIPEQGCFIDPQADTLFFVAIKTGDVDCSALVPTPAWPVKVLEVAGPLNLKAGDEATVRVRLRESVRLSGIQMGIAIKSPSALQWVSGGLSSALADFGDTLLFRETATGVLMAYMPSDVVTGEQVDAGSAILSFRVKAISDVYLPDVLAFGYKLTPELYTPDMHTFALEPLFMNELAPDTEVRRNFARKESGVVLFPNPADDVLTITHGSGGGRMLIADPLGRVVFDRVLAPDEEVTRLQTGQWPAGAYTWSLLRGDALAVGRLVVGRP